MICLLRLLDINCLATLVGSSCIIKTSLVMFM